MSFMLPRRLTQLARLAKQSTVHYGASNAWDTPAMEADVADYIWAKEALVELPGPGNCSKGAVDSLESAD
jgi:hypothetical protein